MRWGRAWVLLGSCWDGFGVRVLAPGAGVGGKVERGGLDPGQRGLGTEVRPHEPRCANCDGVAAARNRVDLSVAPQRGKRRREDRVAGEAALDDDRPLPA